MFCKHCGHPLQERAKFCVRCGMPVPQAGFCRGCGHALRAGAAFCSHCGLVTEKPATPAPAVKPLPNRKGIFALGLLSVIFAGFSMLFSMLFFFGIAFGVLGIVFSRIAKGRAKKQKKLTPLRGKDRVGSGLATGGFIAAICFTVIALLIAWISFLTADIPFPDMGDPEYWFGDHYDDLWYTSLSLRGLFRL